METSPQKYTIDWLAPEAAERVAGFRQDWESLASRSGNLYAFYQTPAWLDYTANGTLPCFVVRLHEGTGRVVGNVRADDGSLAGAVSVDRSRYELFYFPTRFLPKKFIPTIRILGGEPLLGSDPAQYSEMVRSLFAKFPDHDFIYLPFVPIGSPCWNALREPGRLRDIADVHVLSENRLHPGITLGSSFEEYLKKFKGKTRNTLQRKINKFRENSGGLELLRIEQPADVKTFLDEAAEVSTKSWMASFLGPGVSNRPEEIPSYQRFAEQGVLRSYLLRFGGKPCAYVRGFQYGGVFYYSRVAYDQQYSQFSPGTVLLWLMLEDLFAHRPPRSLNFQEGEYEYKHIFSTDCLEKTDILLMRRGARLSSRLWFGAHLAYRRMVVRVKRLLLAWKRRSAAGKNPSS